MPDLGLLRLFLTVQVNQLLHILTTGNLLAKKGHDILLLGLKRLDFTSCLWMDAKL